MKKMKWKRLIALLLAVAMCLSLVSANAWAGEASGDGSDNTQSGEEVLETPEEETAPEEESEQEAAPEAESVTTKEWEEESEQVPVAPDVPEEVKQPETEKPKREKNSKLETQEIVASGNCGAQGANVTWTLDDEGTLTISGSGEMEGYMPRAWGGKVPWREGSIRELVLLDGITSIGRYAFEYCNSMTSVDIPDSVTNIGEGAFGHCTSLTSVMIPKRVTSIGNGAFSGCQNLTSISIPDSVTSIEGNAFRDCSSLTSITIPDSVTNIGANAFSRCGLTSIDIPDSVTSIGEFAFQDCSSLTSITIPDSVTNIGANAFSWCGLTSIDIPDSVTSIGQSAFQGCRNLTSITIPSGVTSIEDGTFSGCEGLTSIDIPDSVTSIGEYAFNGCSSLTSITIPDSVTSIGQSAFQGCRNLTSITIPSGVTSIEDGTFSGCEGLTTIDIPNSVTSIGEQALYGCSSLTSITIPDSMTSIGWGAFHSCSSLTSINIPNSVTSIEGNAFRDCSSLTSIDIPDSVTSIGQSAFEGCRSLKCIDIPDSVTSIGWEAFHSCSSLTSINIPNSVTSIEGNAFRDCSSLTSIDIPDSVTSIGWGAFDSCDSLTSVSIGNSVTSIGECAFYDCSSLTEICFYGNVPSIGDNCFDGVNVKVTATAYYPANNPTWTDEVKQDYGGNITWKEWVPGTEIDRDVSKEVSSYSDRFTFQTELDTSNGKVEVEKTENCVYKDSFFTNPSDEYNHDLAKMSLALAMSAFNSTTGVKLNQRPDADKYTYRNPDSKYALENTRAKNVANLLYECGFGHIRVNQDYLVTTRYLVVPGQESVNDGNNIGVCIGSKKLDDEYTLIAVALRGAGYGDEWIGNFNAYNTGGSFHPGFKRASNKALTEILNYIQNQKITGKVKVWITGYSRSGATANLTAAKLCENNYDVITLRSDDVYAYTFEAPQGTKDKNADDEKYDGIWNIVNQIDPVPKVAMTKWGYLRYGQDVYLPCQYTNSKVYNQYKNKVLKQFNQYQEEGYLTLPHILNQMKNINTLVDGFAGLLGSDSTNRTRTSLYLIQKSFVDKAQSGAKELTFTEGLYDAFFKLLNNFNFAQSVALESSVNQIKNQLEAVVISHYPTMTLAWMQTIPESAMSGTGGMCRYVRANCPVDLSVYDEDGVLQARIIDDTVYPEEDATIEAEVDADGQKVVTVPGDANVTIKVNATDNGIFNYSVSEYDSEKEESTKILNYYDIPILNGSELDAVIQDEECNESTRYQLMVQDSQIQPSEQLTGAEIENYNVTVRAKGSGTVIGTSTKTKGEFAMVTATPNEGGEFLGWYEGDNLVSQEANYRFRVERNVTLMARFTILPTLGDLNFDGEFTMADVVLLNRYVLGKNSLTPEQLALGDVTGDGDVTMADVVVLNRFVVGLIKSL